MKREIIRAFSHGSFTWPDAEGADQIVSWGRLHVVPGPVPTAIEMVETDPAVFDEIAADPDIVVGEEISDAVPE